MCVFVRLSVSPITLFTLISRTKARQTDTLTHKQTFGRAISRGQTHTHAHAVHALCIIDVRLEEV